MKDSEYLVLCFMLVCIIFVRFYIKSDEKPTQNEVKIAGGSELQKEEVIVQDEAMEEVVPEPMVEGVAYRLTSFWSNDGYGTGSCTGSGLCEDDFQTNDKGWYVYDGRLVLASATYECLNSKSGACGKWNTKHNDKTYYRYGDIVNLSIDGTNYEGIILDSCGACMYIDYEQRLDLFVSGEDYAIDRGYRGNNTITVFKEEGRG